MDKIIVHVGGNVETRPLTPDEVAQRDLDGVAAAAAAEEEANRPPPPEVQIAALQVEIDQLTGAVDEVAFFVLMSGM